MKVFAVLLKSVKVYVKNFADLMGAFLIQGVLRAICLTPLMFLLTAETAVWAWLCVPLYLLIALPARQNYAIAMQDMLHGGRVFSARLVSLDGYFGKLWRGLKGMLKMAVWMVIPAVLILLLVQLYQADGWLSAVALRAFRLLDMENFAFADLFSEMEMEAYQRCMDGRLTDMLKWVPKGGEMVLPIAEIFSFDLSDDLAQNGFLVLAWFGAFGEDPVYGLINVVLVLLGTFLLPVIGCAVHCGNRHAAALEDKKLLRGKRLKLMVLWALGFVVFLPFAAVTVTMLLSDLKGMVMGLASAFFANDLASALTGAQLGEKLYIIGAAFVLLFLTVVPFKQLIPAVAAHEQMKAAYPPLAGKAGSKNDAQA